jgi:hypothetical protein
MELWFIQLMQAIANNNRYIQTFYNGYRSDLNTDNWKNVINGNNMPALFLWKNNLQSSIQNIFSVESDGWEVFPHTYWLVTTMGQMNDNSPDAVNQVHEQYWAKLKEIATQVNNDLKIVQGAIAKNPSFTRKFRIDGKVNFREVAYIGNFQGIGLEVDIFPMFSPTRCVTQNNVADIATLIPAMPTIDPNDLLLSSQIKS